MSTKRMGLAGVVVCLVFIALGTGLRVLSVRWNDRLHGDIILMALTARNFYEEGRLYYPFKYEYMFPEQYREFKQPAAQHPPLFPFLAGVISLARGSDDTYAAMKALSFAGGVLGLLAVWGAVRRSPLPGVAPWALGLAAFMPMLVSFSGNGSPYIWLSTLVVMLSLVLLRFRPDRPLDYALIGILLGVGYMSHKAIVMTVPGVVVALAVRWRELRPRYLAVVVVAGLVTISPHMTRDVLNFGTPFYSTKNISFKREFKTHEIAISGDEIVLVKLRDIDRLDMLKWRVRKQWSFANEQLKTYATAMGPAMILLVGAGVLRLLDDGIRPFLALCGPAFSYPMMMVLIIPWHNERYILPPLTATCILAAIGYRGFAERGWPGRLCGLALMGMVALWWAADYKYTPGQLRYYTYYDDSYVTNYDKLRELALEMRGLEEGPVLSYTTNGPDGFLTTYYNHFPVVSGRASVQQGLFGREEVEKLVRDFEIRYIWSDSERLEDLQAWFPPGRVILSNEPFLVFDLRPESAAAASPPDDQPAS